MTRSRVVKRVSRQNDDGVRRMVRSLLSAPAAIACAYQGSLAAIDSIAATLTTYSDPFE